MKKISTKLNICYFFTTKEIIEIEGLIDPLTKLLENFEEIQTIINISKEQHNSAQNITLFLYYNNDNIKNILFKYNEIIRKNSNTKKNSLAYFFYFSLINENVLIIDYTYPINFINETYNQLYGYCNRISNDSKIKCIIMSKFIIELINCYKNSDEFNVKDSNEKKVLQKIEDYCNKFIENNLSNLEEIGLNLNLGDLISKNIDEIYAEIIISLIINNKFYNFDKIKRIVEQLELKSIIITKKMYKKLSDALSLNNQYMKNYILSSIDDLLNDQKKLNFFYILLE